MKIKDRDLERMLRNMEEKIEELKDSLRDSFVSLKRMLRRSDWWGVIADAENIIEDASELKTLEDIYKAIKERVEE